MTGKIIQKLIKDTARELKWYIRKHLFNIKEGSNGGIDEIDTK